MTATRTTEASRPMAGDHFRHVAALRLEGAKRRKLLALVAAYRDGGQMSVKTAELGERLDWEYRKVDVLAQRLAADEYLAKTHTGRWRLSDEIIASVKAAQKAAES